MNEHPSLEKIKMFLADRLKGDEAAEVMLHLEKCEICYERLPERDPKEVIDKILEDDKEMVSKESNEQRIENPKTKSPRPDPVKQIV